MSVTFKISDIYSQADAWEAPNADYGAINASLGPGSALNRTQAATGIANLSTRTPIVVAFLLSANPDRIYLGHTVAIYPGDACLNPTYAGKHLYTKNNALVTLRRP